MSLEIRNINSPRKNRRGGRNEATHEGEGASDVPRIRQLLC